MSNPRTLRTSLLAISETLKTQSNGSSNLTQSRARSQSTSSPTSTSFDTQSNSSLSQSQMAMANAARIRHLTHVRQSNVHLGTQSSHQTSRNQMVAIYDRPAWSSQPREQSILDLAASEAHASGYNRVSGRPNGSSSGAGTGTKGHPAMTVHIYDGPSCPPSF